MGGYAGGVTGSAIHNFRSYLELIAKVINCPSNRGESNFARLTAGAAGVVCVALPETLRVRLPRGLLRWQRPRAVCSLPRAKIGVRMAGQERHVPIVEDEQDERYGRRAKCGVIASSKTARGKSNWRSTAAGNVA